MRRPQRDTGKLQPRGCVVKKSAVLVILIALCAMASFIATTAVVSAADTSTTTTATSGSTTTTTASGESTTTTSGGSTTTGGGSTGTTLGATTTTTNPVNWWRVDAIDVSSTKMVPSFISSGNGYLVWTGTIPGGYSNNYVYNVAKKTNSQIPTAFPGNYYNPSCDGSTVVYEGGPAGGYDDIYLYDIMSGQVEQITHNSDPGDANDWNPRLDDGRIVWQKDMVGPDAKPGIYTFDTNTGDLKCVLAGTEYRDPDIWEDYVVAVKDTAGGGTEIVLLNLKTDATTTIADATKNNEHPRIDSGAVVWSSGDIPSPIYYPWDTYQILMYEISSGTTYPLTDNKLGNTDPSIGDNTVVWNQTDPSGIVVDFVFQGIEYRSDPTKTWKEWGKNPDVEDSSHFTYFDDQKKILNYAVCEPNGVKFIDVGDNDPYAKAINYLASKQIVEGYSDGNFGINDPVTRQQFSKMILLTMAQYNAQVYTPTLHDNCSFSDSASIEQKEGDLYAIHYVARASSTGLTLGYPDGTFRPLANISRQQVITMVVRAISDKLQAPPANWQGMLSYADPEHGERIRTAEYNGLLKGIVGGTFGGLSGWDTRGNATRGEVAQMLYNLLNNLGLITN